MCMITREKGSAGLARNVAKKGGLCAKNVRLIVLCSTVEVLPKRRRMESNGEIEFSRNK
jgi:hypothetical protein